jgi:hypothetical protein
MPINNFNPRKNTHVLPYDWAQQPDGKWIVTKNGLPIAPYADDYFPLPAFPSARTAQAVAEALHRAFAVGHSAGSEAERRHLRTFGCRAGQCRRYTVEMADAQARALAEEQEQGGQS